MLCLMPPGRGRNAEITDDEKAWIINMPTRNLDLC